MDLKGKRVAILCEQLFEDLELLYPRLRLKEAGCEVDIVAPKKGQSYPSKHGYPIESDVAVEDISAEDYDGLVIPGGYSPDHMRRHRAMVELTKNMAEQGKPVAAICHGGWMLCSARVLKGKKVTSFFAIRDDMENAGAEWVDQEVVKDHNLVTSRKPDDLPAFMRSFMGLLIEGAKS